MVDIVERLRETAAEFESIGHDADELHEACDEIKRLRADYERVSHRQADLVCEVANLRTERDALKQDAKRYRWIIKHMRLGIGQNGAYWSLTDATQVAPNHIGEVDATIDAALADRGNA